MTWEEYEERYYVADLEAFVAAASDGATPRMLRLCDCSAHEVAGKASKNLAPDRHPHLLTEVFLEAALLAGVHCYDAANYSAYAAALPYRVFVHSHAFGLFATYHPQVLLPGLPTWDESALAVLEEGARRLCRAWASRYSRMFEPGSGARVLRGLAADEDLRTAPYSSPPAVVEHYRRGLTAAT